MIDTCNMITEFYKKTLTTPSVVEVEISSYPGVSSYVIIKDGTSENKNDVNDDDVIFYCNNIVEFFKLCQKNNGEDFYVTKIIEFN